jgi:hypothetical protein
MARIFLAAADSPVDRADLDRSVANPIDRQLVIRHFSDGSYPELLEIERRGHGFYAWGVPANAALVEEWFLMGVGDFVLVGQRGTFRFYARVLGRYDNERAARAIWGPASAEAGLRQYLLFLSEPMALAIPYRDLADWLPAPDGPCQRVPDDRVAQLVGEFGSVERFARKRLLNADAGGPLLDMSGMIRVSERDLARLQAFDAADSKAGRQAVVESIIKRRGQPGLRHALLAAYEGRCAITGCNAPDALEAAYIVPFHGRETHQPGNGLLLRADLHTLFDLGKIAIDTRTMTVLVADDLMETTYKLLAGRPLRLPEAADERPDREALDLHRRLAGL